LHQAAWTAAVVGDNDGGWEELVGGDVTKDMDFQTATDTMQVLGLSYARQNQIIYSTN
jgi:hypothetical protein